MTATIRQALLSRLREEWDPTNVGGWDPTLPWGDANRLYAHLGEYDDSMPEPQLTLTDVAADERNDGVSGWKSDGSGVVQQFDAVLQVSAWADEDVSRASEELAESLALEAREIVHDQQGILAAVAGPEVYSDYLVALSRPTVIPDPDAGPGAFQATFDVGARLREEPPTR